MNKKAVSLLEEWDPFEEGMKAYAREITKVLEALDLLDDPADLAKEIRRVYEQTFKLWIPIEKCVHISYKLLALKFKAKSIV